MEIGYTRQHVETTARQHPHRIILAAISTARKTGRNPGKIGGLVRTILTSRPQRQKEVKHAEPTPPATVRGGWDLEPPPTSAQEEARRAEQRRLVQERIEAERLAEERLETSKIELRAIRDRMHYRT